MLFQLPLVVSYYTKNTPYEQEVKHLRDSCDRYGIEHQIVGVEDRGSWEENCAFKPFFLRKMMDECKRPLLWVDADAVFLQPLHFEDFMFSDLVFYYEPKIKDPRFSAFAGTVYINHTPGGRQSLDTWCHYSELVIQEAGSAPPYLDQASLHFSMLGKREFNFRQLPIIYAKIFDRILKGIDPDSIVIQHNQASRRFVNKMGDKTSWQTL